MELRIRNFILVTICLVCSALATGDRAAMVIETKGNNTFGSEQAPVRMRTLQVLPEGAKVTVPDGAVLRLSYFATGNKEKIVGPCALEIQLESSKKLAGTGKIEIQARRNAGTELDKSNNLRRMGGDLQAKAGDTPDSELRKLNEVALADPSGGGAKLTTARPQAAPMVTTPVAVSEAGAAPHRNRQRNSPAVSSSNKNVERNVKPASKASNEPVVRPEYMGRNLAYLEPKDAALVEWTPGLGGSLTLKRDNKVLFSSPVAKSKFQLPSEHLKAGNTYQLVLENASGKTTQEFRIFTKAEVHEYRALVANVKRFEVGDGRSMLSQLIVLNQELGLLQEAENTAKFAVNLYKDNSGFWMALGQIQAKLNKKEEARSSFSKAKELESAQ